MAAGRHDGSGDAHRQCHFRGQRSQVVAWTLATETLNPHRMTALEAMLDPDEWARADRFTFPADRRDFVAAHGLFKEMLAAWLGLPPSQLRLSVDPPAAKPRLTAPGYV